MSKRSTLFFAVASLVVAALGIGQAALAAAPCAYTSAQADVCYPGNPQFHTGFCSCTYGTATKSSGGANRAWFILNSNHTVSVFSESPAGWVGSWSGWSDGGSWSQNFLVEFPAGSYYLCSASAQPGGAEYVTASVIHNWSSEVEVSEHWTSTPNKFYDAPVLLTCWVE